MRAFWPVLVLAGFLRLVGDLLAFVGPWCVEHVVTYAYKQTRVQTPPSNNDPTNQTAFVSSYQDNVSNNLTVILDSGNSTQVFLEH